MDRRINHYAAATVWWLSCTSCNGAPNSSTEGSVRNELSTVVCHERLANEMSEPLWSKSTSIESPKHIWPLATRFDIGITSSRSIERFKWRAPYLLSIPSRNNSSFTESEQLQINVVLAELMIRCCKAQSSRSRIRRR